MKKTSNLKNLQKALKEKADPERAKILRRFFKTGRGEYGEGDIFLGVTVPEQRSLARQFTHLSLTDISWLLKSKIHEERLLAVLILVEQYQKANISDKNKIAGFYLKHATFINNWDLVDLSAHRILGEHLFSRSRAPLYKLARSQNLWKKRIAIVSTLALIKKNDFNDTLKIAKILISDKHDLIHKAVGWMLREVGKRSRLVHKNFLKSHYKNMPRTSLRYAIEKLPPRERQKLLNKRS